MTDDEKMRPKTDFTNIKCSICGRDNLTSETAIRGEYIREDLRWKWVCRRCYKKDYQNNNPNSTNSAMKSVAGCRTGNLSPNCNKEKGNLSEELTCQWKIVENLNIKNNNYRCPLDHTADSKERIPQTKSRLYDCNNGNWTFSSLENEWNKKFDYVICYCMSKDGKIIERIYEIPKLEIIERKGFTIVKNHTSGIVPWYEQYRIKDEEEIKKVNEMWSKIINKKIKKNKRKKTSEIIQELAEVLTRCDEEFIEEIANKVLTRKVKYIGSGTFEQENK